MARLEALEHGDPSAQRDWLLRASRAPRDAAWIADGVTSDTWQPVSPISGRLDAFQWQYPQEALTQTATAQDMIEAFAEDPLTRSKTALSQSEPSSGKTRLSDTVAERANKTGDASASPSSRTQKPVISDVVFPLATSPDDPGPALADPEKNDMDTLSTNDRFFVRR